MRIDWDISNEKGNPALLGGEGRGGGNNFSLGLLFVVEGKRKLKD